MNYVRSVIIIIVAIFILISTGVFCVSMFFDLPLLSGISFLQKGTIFCIFLCTMGLSLYFLLCEIGKVRTLIVDRKNIPPQQLTPQKTDSDTPKTDTTKTQEQKP